MKLNGRRESGNVRDMRGKGGKTAGLGLGGLVIVGLITWLLGGNPLDVIQQAGGLSVGSDTEYVPTPEEEALAKFSRQILAGTEDVWTAEFSRLGLRYEPPTLVLFSGSVQSDCGGATSSTGPFYCSADQSVYIDLSFFSTMKEQFGSLEAGDLEEGLEIAARIGDDYLQKQAQGYAVPETFNHGTSAQRARWLKKGFSTGDINKGDTFSVKYNNL